MTKQLHQLPPQAKEYLRTLQACSNKGDKTIGSEIYFIFFALRGLL